MLALRFVHSAGWVHRDISTGNILIDSHGNTKLADFEYAKKLDDNEGGHEIRTVCFPFAIFAVACLIQDARGP